MTQREALHALGVDGARPPLELAYQRPGRLPAGAGRSQRGRRLTDHLDSAGTGGSCTR